MLENCTKTSHKKHSAISGIARVPTWGGGIRGVAKRAWRGLWRATRELTSGRGSIAPTVTASNEVLSLIDFSVFLNI